MSATTPTPTAVLTAQERAALKAFDSSLRRYRKARVRWMQTPPNARTIDAALQLDWWIGTATVRVRDRLVALAAERDAQVTR